MRMTYSPHLKLWGLRRLYITPVDAHYIPTGAFKDVEGTAYNFEGVDSIGSRIYETNADPRGYDMNYVRSCWLIVWLLSSAGSPGTTLPLPHLSWQTSIPLTYNCTVQVLWGLNGTDAKAATHDCIVPDEYAYAYAFMSAIHVSFCMQDVRLACLHDPIALHLRSMHACQA